MVEFNKKKIFQVIQNVFLQNQNTYLFSAGFKNKITVVGSIITDTHMYTEAMKQ